MNNANSFVHGFAGGMGLMNNVLNDKARRAALREQQKNQQFIQNASAVSHIRESFKTPEQKSAFDTQMIRQMNQDADIQALLNRHYDDGNQRNLVGFEVTRNGIIPQVEVRDPKGTVLNRGALTNPEGKSMAVDQDAFFSMVGQMPDIVKTATKTQAQILSAGGKLPEEVETFSQKEKDGLLYNVSDKTNKGSVIGYTGRGMGGRSGSGSGTGNRAGSLKKVSVIQEDREDGSFRYLFTDGQGGWFEQWRNSQGQTGFDDVSHLYPHGVSRNPSMDYGLDSALVDFYKQYGIDLGGAESGGESEPEPEPEVEAAPEPEPEPPRNLNRKKRREEEKKTMEQFLDNIRHRWDEDIVRDSIGGRPYRGGMQP